MYRPLNAFMTLGGIIILIGLLPVLRFLYFFMIGEGEGKVQSLILGGVFLSMGYVTIILALLGDTVATNRQLSERILKRVRELELATTPKIESASENTSKTISLQRKSR